MFCTEPVYVPLASSRDLARAHAMAWRELAAPHDAMVTHPEATASLLMELAS